MLADWQDLGSVQEIAAAVRSGTIDPIELTERALRRAEETAELNAVIYLDAEGARAAAATADRGGALAGVPVLVKEIIEVEGLPFRCGSRAFEGRIGTRDAEIVRRLRSAGAVIVGLSHSHEFAYGCTGTSNRAGPCRNPHDLDRITGGSSAGAGAAVAAGVVPLAIGTDTAGSVRIPAALCGVVGVKPARATLPVDGVFPLAQSLDHVGVLAGTVSDAQYAIEALADTPVRRTASTALPRLGLVSNPEHRDNSAEVGQAWSVAIERLRAAGATTVDVELPDWSDSNRTAVDLQGFEAVANHAGRSIQAYQADVQERLREAAEVPAWRYAEARTEVAELTAAVGALFSQVDALLLPTVPIVAPPIDAVADLAGSLAVRAKLLRNTRLANLTGHPSLSLPLPTSGLPVGLQILASDNQAAWQAAAWIEQTLAQTS
ncbi:MAG: aspartyl-tRNA(Asn)/glutamyl-tRNA(Gln) amidotransferase subunit [Kribbellaceae bacterium]|nr:aspartyl-tRNA(Asn)/glutamyl-tRNA(Gln) amidotransferase subunit [Kribbellaceae bacterium]